MPPRGADWALIRPGKRSVKAAWNRIKHRWCFAVQSSGWEGGAGRLNLGATVCDWTVENPQLEFTVWRQWTAEKTAFAGAGQ